VKGTFLPKKFLLTRTKHNREQGNAGNLEGPRGVTKAKPVSTAQTNENRVRSSVIPFSAAVLAESGENQASFPLVR
jgi:hypothetical protein